MFRIYVSPPSTATTLTQSTIPCLDCCPSFWIGFPASALTFQQPSLNPSSRGIMLKHKSDMSLYSKPCTSSPPHLQQKPQSASHSPFYPVSLCPFSYLPFPHSVPTTLASLLFRQHSTHAPALVLLL